MPVSSWAAGAEGLIVRLGHIRGDQPESTSPSYYRAGEMKWQRG